jgi:hypothetical protein
MAERSSGQLYELELHGEDFFAELRLFTRDIGYLKNSIYKIGFFGWHMVSGLFLKISDTLKLCQNNPVGKI